MKANLAGLALLVLLPMSAHNASAGDAYHNFVIGDLPSNIKVELESGRTNYFLGENILLHYRVENTGDKPFKISTGGDYRGSTRADRFEVSAISSAGELVPDPTPLMRNMGGGIMGGGEIQPGDKWYENVWVIEYCRFEAPGTYRIEVFHDLGFGDRKPGDVRTVSMEIRLDAPTDTDVRRILDEAESAKPYHGNTWGKKGEARLDYNCIRFPAFLPALIERAQQRNSLDAVTGIRGIRTVEATRALVGLLAHTNANLAKTAAEGLEWRQPHSEAEFHGPWGDERRQYYVQGVWTDGFNPPVCAYVRQLLSNTNKGDLLLATKLLRRIGTQAEVPHLLSALEHALPKPEFLSDIHYPAPIRVCDELLGVAMGIDTNLDIPSDQIRTPAQALIYMARHGGENLKPNAEPVFSKLARHPSPYVRMKAVETLPKEIPPSLVPSVTTLLTDSNPGVQTFAFETARRINEPKHRGIALKVLKQANEEWLRRAASDMAIRYGARYECAKVWVSHLVPPANQNDYLPHDAKSHLRDLVVEANVSVNNTTPKEPESARVMREAWDRFLDEKREKIEAGQKFKVDELPAGLGITAYRVPTRD